MATTVRHLRRLLRPQGPRDTFLSEGYIRRTRRRQEHLATLGLPLSNRTVLEVGAAVGDHTGFFVDRGCKVVATDGRPENVAVLRERLPDVDARVLDLDQDPDPTIGEFEIVHCYGTLYHLGRPVEALDYMAERCTGLLLIDTRVITGAEDRIEFVDEHRDVVLQAVSGKGCRPTRAWVLQRLRERFPHAYMTRTQPWDREFPIDWDFEWKPGMLTRAVFVASREPLENSRLSEDVVDHQTRD